MVDMDDFFSDLEMDMGSPRPAHFVTQADNEHIVNAGHQGELGIEGNNIDHLSDNDSQPEFNIPQIGQDTLETQHSLYSIPIDPTHELKDKLASVNVPIDMISKIIRVVFDGLHRSVEWTLSVSSFEQLLELLRSTWVEATGNAYEGQFFPKTMEDTLSILRLAGYQDATVYYTCLKKDHFNNMKSASDTCPVCGCSASTAIKWLYVGRCRCFNTLHVSMPIQTDQPSKFYIYT